MRLFRWPALSFEPPQPHSPMELIEYESETENVIDASKVLEGMICYVEGLEGVEGR